MIGSWPALRGRSEYNFSVVPALFTVYLLHELKVPDKRVYDRDKTKIPPLTILRNAILNNARAPLAPPARTWRPPETITFRTACCVVVANTRHQLGPAANGHASGVRTEPTAPRAAATQMRVSLCLCNPEQEEADNGLSLAREGSSYLGEASYCRSYANTQLNQYLW